MLKIFLLFNFCFLSVFTSQAKSLTIDPDNLYPKVKFETSMGNIIVELDRVKAPTTVNNFLNYVINREYDGTIFHRVIKDFIVQGGGYDKDLNIKKINQDIINESGNGLKNEIGSIAMAKSSKPHSANRQFFFNVVDNKNLDPCRNWGYAVFGHIIQGQDVLNNIAKAKTDYHDGLGWSDVPVETITINKITLLPTK